MMLTRKMRMPESEEAAAVPLQDLAEISTASNTTAALHCPQCDRVMAKERFQQMIPIPLDFCRACDFVWLDAGERALVHRLYQELMTSTDPEIVSRREKVGTVLVQWQAHEAQTDENLRYAQRELRMGVDHPFDLLTYLLRDTIR